MTCPHCRMDIAIRNPSGYCDHLKYPENCEPCQKGAVPQCYEGDNCLNLKTIAEKDREIERLKVDLKRAGEALAGKPISYREQSLVIKDLERVIAETNGFLNEQSALLRKVVGALERCRVTMSHAFTFVQTREKMHPTGIELYRNDLNEVVTLLSLPELEPHRKDKVNELR